MGTVRLVNAVFYAHHGVSKEEHRLGGRYEVDVAMDLDFEDAAETDRLDSTVDYEGVYKAVHQLVTGNKFYLIEKLAVLICRAIMERTHSSIASRQPYGNTIRRWAAPATAQKRRTGWSVSAT